MAIVPVVLFHAGVGLIPGGFTGVDVFFVISGYLITSIIVDEIEQDRFSVWAFYQRRALRILPAYLALIVGVLCVSWFTLFPDETRALGESVVAASLFVSNFHFWSVSDYFSPDLKFAPLLHTWTLAVEEQYYLFLPLFLLLIARYFKQRFALFLILATGGSFILNVFLVRMDESATFYLLPTRLWEFGLGSIAAVTGLSAKGGAKFRVLAALAGLMLVTWGFLRLNEASTFPGYNAIFPALGTMLLICFAQGTFVGRVLALRPLEWLGLISYSLYLWHWPVIVFWKLHINPVLDLWHTVAVIVISLILAVFSYRFVEAPFRARKFRNLSALQVNGVALVGLLLAAGSGVLMVRFADAWGDVPEPVQKVAAYVDYWSDVETHACFVHARTPGRAAAYDPQRCLAIDANKTNWLLAGDSHLQHLLSAMESNFSEVKFQIAAATGCKPLSSLRGSHYCAQVVRPALMEHVQTGRVDGVLLSARWKFADVPALQQTVSYLLEHVDKVVILGPTPEYSANFPRLLARTMRAESTDVSNYLVEEVLVLDEVMRGVDWQGGTYVSLVELLCEKQCRVLTKSGVPYVADYGHYTQAAAMEIAADLAAASILDLPSELSPQKTSKDNQVKTTTKEGLK